MYHCQADLLIIGLDIQCAAGPLQLCAGQTSGVEAAIHSIFCDENSEGFLLVETSNDAFNRAVVLQNIQDTCPAFSTILINTYRLPAPLYVTRFHITRLPHTQNQTYDFTRNGLLV